MSISWFFVGSLTTLIASTAAIVETDAKKIVALSTLSQLGLMAIALFLGGKTICFFHLICHALAKANLFLVIGRLLRQCYSQQDSRKLSVFNNMLRIALVIRIVRLSGILFQSGIYSKEQIFSLHCVLVNRFLSWFCFFFVIVLTLSYCLKLFSCLLVTGEALKISVTLSSKIMYFPVLILSVSTMLFGFLFCKNTVYCSLTSFKNYWVILTLFFFFLFIKKAQVISGFSLQSFLVKLHLGSIKKVALSFSILEYVYFLIFFSSENFFRKKTFNVLMLLISYSILFFII